MKEKERKILATLAKNSRIAKTQLAKEVGLSQETLNYQLTQLEKKYDLSYYAIINYRALGFERYGVFFQLKAMNTEQEKNFFAKLNQHKNSSYIAPLIGKWNIVIDIFAKDKNQLYKIIEELTEDYKQFIDTMIINSPYLPEEFYQQKLFKEKSKILNIKTTAKTIDTVDATILKLLSANARISYAELSTQMQMTANGVKKRIKKLEQEKIILGYGLGVSLHKLGYETYVLQIKHNQEETIALQEYVRQHPQTLFSYYYLGLGEWDGDIGIFVKHPEEVRVIIMELKEKFGEHIQIQNMYIIGEITKENITPEGVFE